jgi:hypothetical protein
MRLLLTALAVVVLELAGSTPVFTQSPDINELRRRVAVSARRFITEFSNLVTEEEYDQRFSVGSRRRRLTSDFLLVAFPGRKEVVMVFRDVREVDGKPVRDKQERITKLFLQPFDDAVRRAKDIQREGAAAQRRQRTHDGPVDGDRVSAAGVSGRLPDFAR